MILIEHLLPEVKLEEGRCICDFICHNSLGDNSIDIDQVVQKADDIKHTQQPDWTRGSNSIHDVGCHPLDVLDLALHKVLVLIVGLRLSVLDAVCSQDILYLGAGL